MPLHPPDVQIFSGDVARERLSDEMLRQTLRSLLDDVWDDAYKTVCTTGKGNIPLSQLYPELVCPRKTRHRLLSRATRETRARLQGAFQDPLLPWTYVNAFELLLEEARELRAAGQYSIAMVRGQIAAAMAYKYEGRLANGQQTFSPTKAAVIDEYRNNGIYTPLWNEVMKCIGAEVIGPVLVFTKNPKVRKKTLEDGGREISLKEHQDIREQGGFRRYPESLMELCRLNRWQAFLLPNPAFNAIRNTRQSDSVMDDDLHITEVRWVSPASGAAREKPDKMFFHDVPARRI